MNFNITFGVPSLFEKRGDRRTSLYMVVSGHYTERGEQILISRKNLERMMMNLEFVSEIAGARDISEALDLKIVPVRQLEKIIKSLSAGLYSVIINKAPGESQEDKLNSFLFAAKAVWEQMNQR